MEPEERAEVEELMNFHDRHGGRPHDHRLHGAGRGAKVEDAIEMLRSFEGGVETVSTIYMWREGQLLGAVPLAKIVLARRARR